MIKNRTATYYTFILLSLVLFSCKKDVNQPEIDKGLIEAYVYKHQLDGTFTSSGLYYVIVEPGSTLHPTLNSSVTCSYKGYSLDGVVFDKGDFITFDLNKVILGWQEGIQLIGEGGKIKLIIPSGLAYGSGGSGSITPNEVIAFDVTLNYFSN